MGLYVFHDGCKLFGCKSSLVQITIIDLYQVLLIFNLYLGSLLVGVRAGAIECVSAERQHEPAIGG